MELNLGELQETIVEVINDPKGFNLAKVKWLFEKGELKWGRISKGRDGDLWVQMPKFNISNGWMTPLKITDRNLENEIFQQAEVKYRAISGLTTEDYDEFLKDIV